MFFPVVTKHACDRQTVQTELRSPMPLSIRYFNAIFEAISNELCTLLLWMYKMTLTLYTHSGCGQSVKTIN